MENENIPYLTLDVNLTYLMNLYILQNDSLEISFVDLLLLLNILYYYIFFNYIFIYYFSKVINIIHYNKYIIMNIVKTLEQYDDDCVYFCDPIKNNIMNDGYFIRIIYSSPLFMLNGIYIAININHITILLKK
jgi:hypothetical protein